MGTSIVLIDDEPLICRVFSLALQKAGHAVITFTNPVKAMEYITSKPPSIVVCDYRMPGMTGLEVLQSLPEELPFVLFSGDISAADLIPGRAGPLAFIPKPVRPDDLIKKILGMLSV